MLWAALAILIVLLGLAVPVAAGLGFLGLALSALYSKLPLSLAVGEMAWATSNNFLLVAIPTSCFSINSLFPHPGGKHGGSELPPHF